MASGKKNYFRHSFGASDDDKICQLVAEFGLEGYAYFFILIELCCRQIDQEIPKSFSFHQRILLNSWLVRSDKLLRILSVMQQLLLIQYTCDASIIKLSIAKLPKYLGRYEIKFPPNSPNKKKRKEKKEKEIKVEEKNATAASDEKAIPQKTSVIVNLFAGDQEIQMFVGRISERMASKFLEEHDLVFLKKQIARAFDHNEGLSKAKKKTNISLFLDNWFEREKKYVKKNHQEESTVMKLLNANPYND